MHDLRKDRHAGGWWVALPPAVCLLLACAIPVAAQTPTPTLTPTPVPTVPTTYSIPTGPEAWSYDGARCSGPRGTKLNGVSTYAAVCGRTGGWWQDEIPAPSGYDGGGIIARVGAYKLAATSATGTLTVACAAQCVADNAAALAAFGASQTVSWSVGSFAQYERMTGATAAITPAGSCGASSLIMLRCSPVASPANPALYPLGPVQIEVGGNPLGTVLESVASAPQTWWYDIAKCTGPRLVSVGSLLAHVGVCRRTGGRWQATLQTPPSYTGGAIQIRPTAWKLAATAATGTLGIECSAQCAGDGDAVGSFGDPGAVSWAVGSFAKYDLMSGAAMVVLPFGSCSELSDVIIECRLTNAPTDPALYPLGPMAVEVML